MKFKKSFLTFKYAFYGLRSAWRKERNFRFHIAVALLVLLAGCLLKVSSHDFILLILMIFLVLLLELINTMVERLVDILRPRIHEYAEEIKNISAATVFLGAMVSVIVGIMVFWSYFWDFFKVCL